MDGEDQQRELLTGAVVSDYQVLADYPQAWSRVFDKLEWPPQAHARQGALSVFAVGRALVGPCFIPLDLDAGRVFKNHFYEQGSVLFPVRDLVGEATFRHRRRPGPTLQGPVLVLGGPIDLNYFHWLLSWCSRIAITQILAPELLENPRLRFLVDAGAQAEPFISHLHAFGVADDRIVWRDPALDYEVENALLVTLPSQNAYHFEVIEMLSRRLIAGTGAMAGRPGRRRRVWVSREQLAPPKRRVVNMADLEAVLERFGVEQVVLESLDPAAQIALFTQAELVVGVHGAGLANVIFCPKDCRVLIIEKEFNVAIGLARTFSVLAQACDLQHEVMVADTYEAPGVTCTTMADFHHLDVVVAPEALAEALSRLI